MGFATPKRGLCVWDGTIGYLCIVIGRSKIHGTEIDNASMITEIATEYGMLIMRKLKRIIAPGRKSFNLSHARIKEEAILIFQKQA